MGQTNWYCITTNPNCQRRAEAELAQRGYWAFWPRMKKWAKHARTKTAKEYPLLGRYMFVEVGEGQSFGEVRALNGVESFVSIAGNPVPIPVDWVKDVMARHLGGEWDFVKPGPVTFRDVDGREKVRQNPPIPVGARVKLLEGEFMNMLATVINRLKGGRLRVVPQGQHRPIITRSENAKVA